jgi:hypothetical protein
MSDFLEGLGRQDRARAAWEAETTAAGSAALRRAAPAAAAMNKGWVDLANYLSGQGARTFEYRHYHVNWQLKLTSHYLPPSPAGFVVSATRPNEGGSSRVPRKARKNLVALALLTPDGRRWNYRHGEGANELPTMGFEPEWTAENLVAAGTSYRIQEDGTILRSKGYGEYEPFFDWLGGLGQKMRSPDNYSWLWQ